MKGLLLSLFLLSTAVAPCLGDQIQVTFGGNLQMGQGSDPGFFDSSVSSSGFTPYTATEVYDSNAQPISGFPLYQTESATLSFGNYNVKFSESEIGITS